MERFRCFSVITMTGSDAPDDSSDDRDRFETGLLAQDRDLRCGTKADIDQDTARQFVTDLFETEVVFPVPEERLLVHDASGEAFESIIQLAVYHRGCTAASERMGDE